MRSGALRRVRSSRSGNKNLSPDETRRSRRDVRREQTAPRLHHWFSSTGRRGARGRRLPPGARVRVNKERGERGTESREASCSWRSEIVQREFWAACVRLEFVGVPDRTLS